MTRLVNRTDVWGRYVRKRLADGTRDDLGHPVTAPFRDERGKVFLQESSLEKHFKSQRPTGLLGLHCTSSDLASRWLAIDIGLHDPDQLSVTAQGNRMRLPPNMPLPMPTTAMVQNRSSTGRFQKNSKCSATPIQATS